MIIKRSIFSELEADISQPHICILLGARQVGKSTLMGELEKVVPLKRGIRRYNLEFPDDLLFFSKSDRELFTELTKERDAIIFIDEFHYLKNASKIFKAVYDTKKNIKIIASGSSSTEMHRHLKESLVGRKKIFKIFPLDWNEWAQTEKGFDDFLTYGSMPGLIHLNSSDEKIEYLAQIVQTYILKDIKSFIKEENIRAFNHLLFFLAENQGQIISTSTLANEVKMSSKTVENHLQILEQTFVVYPLHSYSGKLSNELKKSKKYYFYDLGVRNSLLKNFRPPQKRNDKGPIYESHVFLELHKRLRPNMELRFWRTKQGDEIDFIWIKDRIPTPIEVKSTTRGTPQSILKFLEKYPESPHGIVFNEEREEDVTFKNKLIKYRKIQDIAIP